MIAVYTEADLAARGVGEIGTLPIRALTDPPLQRHHGIFWPKVPKACGRAGGGDCRRDREGPGLDAAELVQIDYVALPAVIDMREALKGEVTLFDAAPTMCAPKQAMAISWR